MYHAGSAYETYRQQEVLTANAVDLIIMLYDGCIKQLKQARCCMQAKELAQANAAMMRAQDIVTELVRSLDLSIPLAKDLLQLYDFILQEMLRINIKKDTEGIQPILDMLESLRGAWGEIRNHRPAAMQMRAEL